MSEETINAMDTDEEPAIASHAERPPLPPPPEGDNPVPLLSRDQILAADDIRIEEVDVPEWDGFVRVRALTGTQRDQFEADITVQKGRRAKMDLRNFRARLVQRCAVDAEGRLLFGESDIPALGKKSAGALDRVYEVAARLSGISEEDAEELLGNSEAGPSDGSTSD